MEGETGSNRTHFPDLIQIKLIRYVQLPTSAEQLHLITLKELYASSNPGRVDFLSSILIATFKLGFIFIAITIGPLFCLFIFFLHNCI